MKNIRRTISFLGAACAFAACAQHPNPAVKAADVARTTCPTTNVQVSEDERTLDETRAVEVQPIMTTGGTDGQGNPVVAGRADGVKVLVQPPPETPSKDLARAMRCRYAQALLGQTADTSPQNAPFYLPHTFVDVNVTREGEGTGLFAVTARTDNTDDNVELMRRTREYAMAHGVAISTDMP
jgi:hypothetical protein